MIKLKRITTLRKEMREAGRLAGFPTQQDLADALKIPRSSFSDIMNGNRLLTPDIVKATAKKCKIGNEVCERWHRLGAIECGWEV